MSSRRTEPEFDVQIRNHVQPANGIKVAARLRWPATPENPTRIWISKLLLMHYYSICWKFQLKLSINFTASVLQQVAPKARDDSNPSAESNRQTIRWTKNTETKLAFIDFNNFHFSKFRASFSNELAFANGRNSSARNCFSWNFEQKKCPQEKPRKSSDWQSTSGRLKVPSSELLGSSFHKLSPKKVLSWNSSN